MTCGIYQIKLRDSNRRYIGSSKNIEFRWTCHVWDLDRHRHVNIFLQRLWDKYGQSRFEFSILEICPKDDLLRIEQHWIDSVLPHERINISKVTTGGGMTGRHHSEESKQKMREANTGRKRPPRSDETRRRMSESRLGKKRK